MSDAFARQDRRVWFDDVTPEDFGQWADCYQCGGDGWLHDCGEDTCPRARPDTDDLVQCGACGGKGGWYE